MKLLLASRSPARRQLLLDAAYDVQFTHADIDESFRAGEIPKDFVRRLAKEKAAAVKVSSDRILITADTVVVFENEIIGKARDANQAREILEKLSGKWHEVTTGFAICHCEGAKATEAIYMDSAQIASHSLAMTTQVITTKVLFHELTNEQIANYLESNEWQGKAGAYGIQGEGGKFVKELKGSFSNVVGLPMEALEQALTRIKEN